MKDLKSVASSNASFLKPVEGGLALAVKVQPRASANEICGPLGGELKIKVTAPPVDSAANEALIEFLAEKLGCAKGAVTIVRGHASRHKMIRLTGLKEADARQRLGFLF
ncbi:MAG: DUF167 domain-containing protein [Limisphaerales bacterium]